MGADLIGVVLTIDKDKKPDWGAAHKWAENLTEDDLFGSEITDAFEQYAPFEDEYAVGENLAEMTEERRKDVVADRQAAIGTSINIAKDIYESDPRNSMYFYVRGAKVWVLAEMSWGDSPEGFDEMWFFIMNGAAEAAGFDGE